MLPHMHPSLGFAEKCLLIAGNPRELNPAVDLFTIVAREEASSNTM